MRLQTIVFIIFCLPTVVLAQDLQTLNENNIKEVKIFDGTSIAKTEITSISLNPERINGIDFIEVNNSLIIDSLDIIKIDLTDQLQNNLSRRIKLDSAGDGSGG